jgi:hypothetical protein
MRDKLTRATPELCGSIGHSQPEIREDIFLEDLIGMHGVMHETHFRILLVAIQIAYSFSTVYYITLCVI